MLVCHDDKVCSIFAVADTARVTSKEAIGELKSSGQIHTVMLTGDNAEVARTIGQAVGIEDVRAGLLPEEKLDCHQDAEV